MDAELLARATEFSFLPESASIGDREVFYFTVTVARPSDDLWAVLWVDQCWNKKAQSREHEPQGHSRTTSVQRGSSLPAVIRLLSSMWITMNRVSLKGTKETVHCVALLWVSPPEVPRHP